jgi:hypothetical protein
LEAYKSSLSESDRHEEISKLLPQLTLSDRHKKDLLRRGFSQEQIEAIGFRSVEKWQGLESSINPNLAGVNSIGKGLTCGGSAILLPIKNHIGEYIGWQYRYDEGDARYKWAASKAGKNRKQSVSSHLQNGEWPLSYCQHTPNPTGIGISEGTKIKPDLIALKRNQIVIGAASGFHYLSPTQLKEQLETASAITGTKTVTLWPDAGACSNKGPLAAYKKSVTLIQSWGFSVEVAWYGQTSKESHPDPDEYDAHYASLEWEAWLAGFEKVENYQTKLQKRRHEQWKRSLTFTPEYIDRNGEYVDPRIFSPKWGSVAVRAPMGSGKTEALKQIVRYWRGQGKVGLLLGSRNSCLAQTCQRLQFPHLLFEGNVGSLLELEPGDFWGHCIDSLVRWREASQMPEIVILDELSSLLPHGLLGSTCWQNRVKILVLFAEILRAAEYVYLLDANLKDWEVDYLEALAGKKFKRVEKPKGEMEPLKIYNFVGSYSPNEPLEFPQMLPHEPESDRSGLKNYKPNNQYHWRQSFLRESKKGPVVVFSDSLKELKRLICLKHGKEFLDFETALSKGILRIDSETRNYPEVRQFQANPVQFLLDYNITELYCSPSVESGISIKFDRNELEVLGKLLDDARDYFVGFWLYNCHLPNEPIAQMLMRVRDRNCPRYLFCRTFAPVPKLDEFSKLETSYLETLNEILKDYWESISTGNDFLTVPEIQANFEELNAKVGEVMAASLSEDMLLHHQTIQKIKSQQTYEKQHLRATLLDRLREDGGNIVDVLGGDGKQPLKKINEAIAYHRAGELFNAPSTYTAEDGTKVEMNIAMAEEWVRGFLVSPEKRLIGERYLFLNKLLPGLEDSGLWSLDFLAEFKYLKSKSYSQLYHRCVLENPELFNGLQTLGAIAQLESGEAKLITDISLAYPFTQAAIKAGIKELIDSDRVYDHNDSYLRDLAKKCSHRTRSLYLGKLGKQAPVQFLNSILVKFGYCLKVVKKKGGGKIRQYKLFDLFSDANVKDKIGDILLKKYQGILEEKLALKAESANNSESSISEGFYQKTAEPMPLGGINPLPDVAHQPNDCTTVDTVESVASQSSEAGESNFHPINPEEKSQNPSRKCSKIERVNREDLTPSELADLEMAEMG